MSRSLALAPPASKALVVVVPPKPKPKLEKRIVADVPEHIHRAMRRRCLDRGILVRDYILALLAKDGIR